MKRVIVIGGGAAGMMAAYEAAVCGANVTLLEKNEKLGKKLFITGKGRCNVCNAAPEMETLFQNVCTNRKFLYGAFYSFDNRAVMELFEKAGCPLKIERGDRVFPTSDHSSDVIGAMKRLLGRENVKVRLNVVAKEILQENGRFHAVRLQNGERIEGDACIICTGGVSYPSTGSTGDGYAFAKEMGHDLTERRPALVPLETKETWPQEVMGLSLKNVRLKMTRGKKVLYDGFGEMMFTHFGVTGPLVLSASSFYYGADKKEKKGKNDGKPEESMLWIDLKPALDEEQLDRRLLREFEENKAKQFKNSLGALFPSKLIPVMIRLSGIHPDKKVSEISREERASFGKLIKNLPLTVKGTRDFAEAIITKGGIAVKQVNPSTMESKLVPGIYFAGEVLDLDALTGGFNLQIAWSTGYLAGKNAAEIVTEDLKNIDKGIDQKDSESDDEKGEIRMSYNIAVDGPAGAGKSTIAKLVAKKKGIIYVDTGAMYRAMALYMLRNQVDPVDKETIIKKCAEANVTLGHEDGQQVVFLNGENVNGLIRTEEVGNMASTISVIGEVRSNLVAKQQALAKTTDCIMDGRDIGTCVLPDANLKIYLTASSEVRAKRRYDELVAKGQECDLEQIQKDIEERDYRDMHREISPLKQADDAILVDTSYMTIEEVVDKILSLAN
ncbi:MAG: (d)CMP kinase [Lachnospiraceae bacterium]|nr:(d)CMP kinase [Lachnospiraceae bacterium]